MAFSRSSNKTRVTLLLWVLVAFFYFYLSWDYIRITTHDQEFADYLRHVVQLAGKDGRPARDIRQLLLVKAEQLELPIRRDQIQIRGGGTSLNVVVNYDVDIEIPLIQSQVYTKNFDHTVKFYGPR
jgi:hypothetical protein